MDGRKEPFRAGANVASGSAFRLYGRPRAWQGPSSAGSDAATRASCVLHGVQYEAYSPLRRVRLKDQRVTSIASAHRVSPAQVARIRECARFDQQNTITLNKF